MAIVIKNSSNVHAVIHNYSVEDAFAYCQTNCIETEDLEVNGIAFECERIVDGTVVSYRPYEFA